MKGCIKILGWLVLLLVSGCEEPWNDPYPNQKPLENALYTAFSERPKHLDPARSYTTAEWPIIGQIYEPPLQYHYLKRPYTLEPLTATQLPEIRYFGQDDREVSIDTPYQEISYTEYTIHIQPNIYYTPHPAFAKDAAGNYRYLQLSPKQAALYQRLSDFKEKGTRELLAEDYVYQLKRLADPSLSSPIFGLMSGYILGLSELRQQLKLSSQAMQGEQDLRNLSLTGAEVVDKYTYRLKIHGKYTPFIYWLATPFFSPVPWEVARFFAQPGLEAHNISLDWYPVGTGPFQLDENNPERRIILSRNPHYRLQYYPSLVEDHLSDSISDLGLGTLAGKTLPMLDKVIYTLEKEDIPYWNKFLQGYYDTSSISSDNFQTAIRFSSQGSPELTALLQSRGITLKTAVNPSIFYWGFNMLDDTVGGNSETARKLRQAINLAFDVEGFLAIFLNNRGKLAKGPLPPEIFGYQTQGEQKSLSKAEKQQNLALAQKMIQDLRIEDLTLYFDTVETGQPDEIAIQAWMKEQFNKLNIRLVIRGTDYNRYQDKLNNGDFQMYFLGWLADFPDPDNFLFLLYGPNGSAKFGGENKSNYSNPDYDKRFEQMRSLPNGPQRYQLVQEMIAIVQQDQPWIWGFYPESYVLSQQWLGPTQPNPVAINTMKYLSLDPKLRAQSIKRWNLPILWPLGLGAGLILLGFLALIFIVWRQQHQVRGRR